MAFFCVYYLTCWLFFNAPVRYKLIIFLTSFFLLKSGNTSVQRNFSLEMPQHTHEILYFLMVISIESLLKSKISSYRSTSVYLYLSINLLQPFMSKSVHIYNYQNLLKSNKNLFISIEVCFYRSMSRYRKSPWHSG